MDSNQDLDNEEKISSEGELEEDNDKLFEDLGFEKGAGLEKWGQVLQEKFGVAIADLQKALSGWMMQNGMELAKSFMNIAPYGDYGKFMENESEIGSFFNNEVKDEDWIMQGVSATEMKNVYKFYFDCKAVDEGDVLAGFVFLGKSGNIRHVFAQNKG